MSSSPTTEIVQVTAIEQVSRAEMDIQITTARQYPRNIKKCIDDARSMALMSREVAESCIYSLPRGGKPISGGSVRLAEIIVNAWEHVRVQGYIVEEGAKHITARGVCADLQKNTAYQCDVRRRITDKNGHRYSEDMINVTANAAISIAIRNAVFKTVPRALWEPIYAEARRASVGDVKSLAERRAGMFQAFSKMGVTEAKLLAKLNRKSMQEVTFDDVADMIGLFNALKDGEVGIDEVFADEAASPPAKPSTGAEKAKAAIPETKPAEPEPEAEGEPVEPPIDECAADDPPPAQDGKADEPKPLTKTKAARLGEIILTQLNEDQQKEVMKQFSLDAKLTLKTDIANMKATDQRDLAEAVKELVKA